MTRGIDSYPGQFGNPPGVRFSGDWYKTKSPQTNGICERFHKTVLNEFYRVAFRKKVYRFIDELQADLDVRRKRPKAKSASTTG